MIAEVVSVTDFTSTWNIHSAQNFLETVTVTFSDERVSSDISGFLHSTDDMPGVVSAH